MELALVAIIDLIAIIGLVALAQSKGGLERALPLATFLLVLVPIESIIPLGLFTLTTHRVVVGMLILLYMTRRRSSNQNERKIMSPLNVFMLLNVVWCLVSTANSIVPTMSIKKMLSVVLEYYLLFFVYWKTVSKVETVHRILMAIVVALIVCSLWGPLEIFRGWDALEYFPQMGHHFDTNEMDREVRIRVTYDHPILYGAALAVGITIALYLLTVVSKQSHKVLLWVGLMLMFYNLYKTSSRGPWLDAVLGCSLLFILGRKRLRKPILYVVALSVAVLIIRPGVWGTIAGLYENTFNDDTSTGSSYAYRAALKDAAVHRLLQDSTTRALWGYGLESFYDVHLEGEFLRKPHVFLSCDNAWVEFLVESGFVGLTIMLGLLITPLWKAWRQFRKLSEPSKDLGLVFFVIFVMYYLQMYSVGMYSWGQNGYVLWIFIALTLVVSKLAAAQAQLDVAAKTDERDDPRKGLRPCWEVAGSWEAVPVDIVGAETDWSSWRR